MSKFLGPSPGRDQQPQHCPTCGSPLDVSGKCPNCATSAPAEDFSSYPRLTVCPTCHQELDETGFCKRCSSRRQALVGLALFVGMPVLGCGSCFLATTSSPLSAVPVLLLFGGPVLGVVYCIYLAFFWVLKGTKRR